MAKSLSTLAANYGGARAAAVATAAANTTTAGEAATVAAIMQVLSTRPDLMNQILRLIPLSVNSGANAVTPG